MSDSKEYLEFSFDDEINADDEKIKIYENVNNLNFGYEKSAQKKLEEKLETMLVDKKIVSEVRNNHVKQNNDINFYNDICEGAGRKEQVAWRSDIIIIENNSNTCCELKLSSHGFYNKSYQYNLVLYDFIKCSLFLIQEIYEKLYKINEKIEEKDWKNKEKYSYMFCFKKQNSQIINSTINVKVKLNECNDHTKNSNIISEVETYNEFKEKILEKINDKNIVYFENRLENNDSKN